MQSSVFLICSDQILILLPIRRGKIEIIHSSGEHLLTIINDVLDMAKIESGLVGSEMFIFDLKQLIERVYEMYSLQAAEKGLKYTLTLSSDLPHSILSDGKKIRQILINLISNAIKFTHSGTVSVSVIYHPDPGEEAGAVISDEQGIPSLSFIIQDTGTGIHHDDKEKIFLPFEQSESGKFRPDGTGLGLPISRTYAEILGGKLTVESSGIPGEGSVFCLKIPCRPVADRTVPEYHSSESEGLIIDGRSDYKILIVDDISENRELLAAFHSKAGISADLVSSGEEAVRWCRSRRPDLIWMDIIMPGMKGDEALNIIRRESDNPPVCIAVTANAFDIQREKLLNQGFDGLLAKPYTEKDVMSILEQFLSISFIQKERYDSPSGHDRDRGSVTCDISSLDEVLRDQVITSAEHGNITRLTRDIQLVRRDSPEIADFLEEKLRAFEFDQIITFLRSKP